MGRETWQNGVSVRIIYINKCFSHVGAYLPSGVEEKTELNIKKKEIQNRKDR